MREKNSILSEFSLNLLDLHLILSLFNDIHKVHYTHLYGGLYLTTGK
jgi:hypothetical protein